MSGGLQKWENSPHGLFQNWSAHFKTSVKDGEWTLANLDRKWAWSFYLRVWDFYLLLSTSSRHSNTRPGVGLGQRPFHPGNRRLYDSWGCVASLSLGGDVIKLQLSHSLCSHHSWTWASNHHTAACTSHTLLSHMDVFKQRDNRTTIILMV